MALERLSMPGQTVGSKNPSTYFLVKELIEVVLSDRKTQTRQGQFRWYHGDYQK
jgi:hypothetical protein